VKKIIVMGSTGSIGTQALDIVRRNSDKFEIVGLSANNNIELLLAQTKEFKPKYICIRNEKLYDELRFNVDPEIEIFKGEDGLCELATVIEGDVVLTSIVGIAGLKPTLKAIESGKNIALANKETLVTAGKLVMEKAKENNVSILPVDSEHSAIFQALNGENRKSIKNIILTASGGPFRTYSNEQMKTITLEKALKHPNWSMGDKITIDSATMMNKGLEVIEAKWLFDIDLDQIEILVHPQSIVHSMVEYIDGSVIAQLGISDMRIPIQYALTFPERNLLELPRLNLADISTLTFEKPDFCKFECLKIALDALKEDGIMPCALNAANEVAVDLFLKQKIDFLQIPKIIKESICDIKNIMSPTLDEIIKTDLLVRTLILKKYDSQ